MGMSPHTFKTYKLEQVEGELLSFNMGQASEYWGVPNDVIPKRKRVVKDVPVLLDLCQERSQTLSI